MLFEEYVKTNKSDFLNKVKEISDKLLINPDWLMATMKLESGINEKAVNNVSGATGLIQFMPATAKNLNTTTDELLRMSNVEQLDFVYKYLLPYKGKMNDLVDVYFAVFFPSAIGKSDSYVLQTSKLSAFIIATQNAGYDLNKNGELTRGEVKQAILKRLGLTEQIENKQPEKENYTLKKKR